MATITYNGGKNYTEVPNRQKIIEEVPELLPNNFSPKPEIPQSLRNHTLPTNHNNDNFDATLTKLRNQPIEGYTAPTRVNPGNNRSGTYSRYVDQPSTSQTNPYKLTGSQYSSKTGFNKAYEIKSCLQCNFPLDQCNCVPAQSSSK